MKAFKQFVNGSVLAATVMVGSIAVKPAQAADVVLITVGGIVATVAIYGLGASGYGTLMLSGIQFKAQDYRQAIDVVAAGDEALITPSLAKFIEEFRQNQPEFNDVNDLHLLEAIVDAVNTTNI
jgi:hypothetical protein